MAQVLKEEIRERIFKAASSVFYEKDFRSATMQEIADAAGVPIGSLYVYFKNKAALFNAIVEPVYTNYNEAIMREEKKGEGLPFEVFRKIGLPYLRKLFDMHETLVILVDRSRGTKHENAKEELIHILERHIRVSLHKYSKGKYDDIFIHILASNFTESILEIARHYKDPAWAERMLHLIGKCYFEGIISL